MIQDFIKKMIVYINMGISWIGTIPTFFLPEKFKGYRTQAFNIGGLFALILSTSLEQNGYETLPEMITNFIGMITTWTPPTWVVQVISLAFWGLGNLKLREKTATPVFVKENAASK